MNKKIKLLGIYPIITTFIIMTIFYFITPIEKEDIFFTLLIGVMFFIPIFLMFLSYYLHLIGKEFKGPLWKLFNYVICPILFIIIIMVLNITLPTILWELTPEQDRFLGTWEDPISGGGTWSFKKNGSLIIENDNSEFENSDVINVSIQDTKINRNYSLNNDGEHIFIDNQRYEYKFENLGEDLYIYYDNDDLFVWLYKDK